MKSKSLFHTFILAFVLIFSTTLSACEHDHEHGISQNESTVENIQTNSQGPEPKIVKSKIINASADAVWERLRQIDGLEEIVPNFVAKSSIDTKVAGAGTKRTCEAPNGQGHYTEQVVDYDDSARYYTYAVLEGVPVKSMLNSFRVIDLGYQKCMVVWTSNYDFMQNPNMTEEQFNGFLNQASDAILAGLDKLHGSRS